MRYNIKVFTTLKQLVQFLNENIIHKEDIISISKENGQVYLIYFENKKV